MLRGRFATTISSETQRCNIVATFFPIVATLFQHCNAVLRLKLSLRIVPCNIISNEAQKWEQKKNETNSSFFFLLFTFSHDPNTLRWRSINPQWFLIDKSGL